MYNKIRRAEAAAIAGALMIAQHAHIELHRAIDLAVLPFLNYLYAAEARLLLVPSIDGRRSDLVTVGEGMVFAKIDALIVRISGLDSASTLEFDVGLHRDREAIWYGPHRLWLGSGASVYLVPDGWPSRTHAPCFMVGQRGLRLIELSPWNSEAERADGFAAADQMITSTLGSR